MLRRLLIADFEETKLPRLVGLPKAGHRRFHAAEKLRGRREHRGTNADSDAARPVPHACCGHPFYSVYELESSTKARGELGQGFHAAKSNGNAIRVSFKDRKSVV